MDSIYNSNLRLRLNPGSIYFNIGTTRDELSLSAQEVNSCYNLQYLADWRTIYGAKLNFSGLCYLNSSSYSYSTVLTNCSKIKCTPTANLIPYHAAFSSLKDLTDFVERRLREEEELLKKKRLILSGILYEIKTVPHPEEDTFANSGLLSNSDIKYKSDTDPNREGYISALRVGSTYNLIENIPPVYCKFSNHSWTIRMKPVDSSQALLFRKKYYFNTYDYGYYGNARSINCGWVCSKDVDGANRWRAKLMAQIIKKIDAELDYITRIKKSLANTYMTKL